jgi:hypothetical protein
MNYTITHQAIKKTVGFLTQIRYCDNTLNKLIQTQKSLTTKSTSKLSTARIHSHIQTVKSSAKNALSLIKQREKLISATEAKINTIVGV